MDAEPRTLAPVAALEIATPRALALPSADRIAAAAELAGESLSANTRRAYTSALSDFRAWCEAEAVSALPAEPETVAAYVAALAGQGRSVATAEQRVAAIRWAHDAAGLETPTASKAVRATMAGIRRTRGVAPKRKAPATVERVAAMVAHCDRGTVKGLRDRALLLLGFATACRRSELVALRLEDLEEVQRGLLVTVRRGKTDQTAQGHTRAVPFGEILCPVVAVREYLAAAGISDSYLFRPLNRAGRVAGERMTDQQVARVVKQYAALAGFPVADFAGHSLRAGFVTSAAERGRRAERIMDHTGHRSVAMVRVYTRRSDAFADHAGDGLL